MKHLITGGSGFLGNLIATRLAEQGEEVVVFDTWQDPNQSKNIIFFKGDVTNKNDVKTALKDVNIVHHNAALVPLTKSGKKFWDVNVIGSKLMAKEAENSESVTSFVHMSSSAIFGLPEHCPIDNSTPTNPIEIYGRSKLEGELAVRKVFENSNKSLVVIRPRTILGGERLGIFQILFEWIMENRNIYIIGKGDHLFQFVHAKDLMDAYMLVIQKNKAGIYNVGTNQFGTLKNDLNELIAYAKSSTKIKHLPENLTINTLTLLDKVGLSPLAPWHYLTYHKAFHFNIDSLTDLGWNPKYSNIEMFKESYDYFINKTDFSLNKTGSAHRKPVKEKILWLLKQFS